jgi:hypothetical protein
MADKTIKASYFGALTIRVETNVGAVHVGIKNNGFRSFELTPSEARQMAMALTEAAADAMAEQLEHDERRAGE